MLVDVEVIRAWHFLGGSRRLRSTGEQVRLGDEIHVRGPIKVGEHGLHASVKVLDALRYAPGPICCRVEVTGTILHSRDRIVGSSRRVIGWCHAGPILWDFARHHFDAAKGKLTKPPGDPAERDPRRISWISARFEQSRPDPADLTSAGWDKVRMLFWDTMWVVGYLESVVAGIVTGVNDPFSQVPDWDSYYNKVSTALGSTMLVACDA